MKQLLLKALLLIGACLGGVSSVWADVIETVGATDKSSENTVHSNTNITLKQGETKIITFNNYGNTEFGGPSDGWYNWRIQAKQGSTVKFEVRADSWDNTSAAATNFTDWNYQVSTTRGGAKSFLEWATFKADMETASCLATITYGTDGTLSLRATSECSTGNIYYHGHDVSGLDGADVNIVFYVDHSYLEITDITSAIGLVGAIDYTSGYATVWNEPSKIWINVGEKAYYKIKNYNKRASAAGLYNNWCVWAATEASVNDIIFCHNHSNTATNATYVSKPELTVADLDGATVELTAELADAGDNTYTYTCTVVTTKADGTVVTPNLVYQQTNLTSSKYKMYVSTDANWLAVLESAVKTNISDAGWATYCSVNALDFSKVATSLKAYAVTDHESSAITKDAITGAVPAGTPLLLNGDASTDYTIPVALTNGTAPTTNLLKAGTGASVTPESGKTKYALSVDGLGKACFKKITAAREIPVGKAYLEFNEEIAAREFFALDESEVTGIGEVRTKISDNKGDFYNLNGQKVLNPTKGLYIVNGKKVLVP